jgi:hypothetical protein
VYFSSDGAFRLGDLDLVQTMVPIVGAKGGIDALALSPDHRTAASVHAVFRGDLGVYLWEVATGKERRRFTGHRDVIPTLIFSPDGRHLVSTSADTTALVWDITGPSPNGSLPAAPLARAETETLWADLGGDDAARAFQAVCALIHRPAQAIALLSERLTPAAVADPAEVRRLLAELGNDRFAVREKAAHRLAQLGTQAEAALRQALEEGPPLEVRRRMKELLEKLDEPVSGPGRLRELRGVEVLEYIRSPEARQVLNRLANGAPAAHLTREARAALERMARLAARP